MICTSPGFDRRFHAIATKISDTLDNEWDNQPFVVRRSKPSWVIKNPAYFARFTLRTLQAEDVRGTAKENLTEVFSLNLT